MKHRFMLLSIVFIFLATDCAYLDKRPNLILITIDTLRADHLHAYGYMRETSPTIDRLAAGGVLFENASTASTRTTQSLAAMMTGRYPQTIGVRVLHGKLKSDEVTLAEVLKQHGYHTAGVSNNTILRGSRIKQGFDFFKNLSRDKTALEINSSLLDWLKQNRGHPVFAWIHYRDPHVPYKPPEEFINRFDTGYRGRFEKLFNFFRKADKTKADGSILYQPAVVFNHTEISPRGLKRIRALYDGEIAYTDMAIGELLEEMKAMGMMDNALVIISADHGESLGEHNYFFDHGDFVYEATVRVPLIFHWPGKISSGLRISQNVRTIDILPTILSLMGIEDPFRWRDGEDLSGAVLGKRDIRDLPVYTESGLCYFPEYNTRRHVKGVNGHIRGLREKNWKLILTPTESESILELYDLDTDPFETRNLAEKEPNRARQMVAKLKKWMGKGGNQVVPAANSQEKELLRALGYIQ